MKETKASFTTEKPVDYTASKDAYDGNLNSVTSAESSEKDAQQKKESSRES